MLARQRHHLRHQPPGGAGAAQGRIGLDMDNDIAIVMLAVIGENGQAVLDQLEAMLLVYCRSCFAGSRYIQGSAKPMGRIHKVPASA